MDRWVDIYMGREIDPSTIYPNPNPNPNPDPNPITLTLALLTLTLTPTLTLTLTLALAPTIFLYQVTCGRLCLIALSPSTAVGPQ